MTRERRSKVSAILLAYNRGAALPSTIESILAQSFGDFELIISDDCSTDNTPEVCAEYARRDLRIRCRRNPKNLRMPGNLNAALTEVRGEYVAILHDGDIYRADLLEKWAGSLDRHPKAAFVCNAYVAIDHRGRKRVNKIDMKECMDGVEFLRQIFVPNWGGCPVFGTTMVRRTCFDAVGLFDPRFSMHSDIEMWVRLASRYDVAYVSEPLITLMPRETNHLPVGHYWWERTVDVRSKRIALQIVHPKSVLARLRFELRARIHYAWRTLPALRHGRWSEVVQGLYLVATGRDEVPPPY